MATASSCPKPSKEFFALAAQPRPASRAEPRSGTENGYRRWLIVSTLALFAGVSLARGQIFAPGARTLFTGAGMYRTTLRVLHVDELVSGSSSVSDPEDRRTTLVASDHSLAWGLAPGWTVAGVVPLVAREARRTGAEAEDSGVGDPLLLAQYDGLYRRNRPGGFSRLALQGSALLPFGGDEFTRDSLDLGVALIGTRVSGRHWVGGDLAFTLATGGPGDLERGDVLSADAYYLYRLGSAARQRALLVWEINAAHEEAAHLDGERVEDSGGDVISLAFGAEIFIGDRIILEAAVAAPIYRDLNGTQPDAPQIFLLGLKRVF